MALDPFLASILKNFTRTHDYEDLKEPDAFEHLVAYCCVAAQHPHPFEVADLCPGGGHDLGLDAVAIIVSGHVVTSVEEWEDLTKHLKRVEVTFVLCQAKLASHFDSAAIGTFLEGALAFFQDKPTMPENEDIADFRAIKARIYADSHLLIERPTLYLHYACAGVWREDPHVTARVATATARLEQTHLFRRIDFTALDSERLRKMHADVTQPVEVTIDFPNHSTISEISKVRQSYIGVIPCKEYLKLIQDERGRIRRSVFSDNVRDFQGDNPVNKEIHGTLSDTAAQEWLPLLNNGVTVVARQIQQVGTNFTLQGFQVVNGCQTSYMIWLNADAIRSNIVVPIKLIETTDLDFTAKVIQATNRQTEVKTEAFESLRKFHKDLEEYYNAVVDASPAPLRYERRSGQYDWSEVETRHVVSLASQLKSYLAVFLEEPQSTHRYYGELLDVYRSRLFAEAMPDYASYHSAALLTYRVDNALRASALRVFRPHIALLLRRSFGDVPGKLKERDKYALSLRALAANMGEFTRALSVATSRLDSELNKWTRVSLHELARRRDFTKSLLSKRSTE